MTTRGSASLTTNSDALDRLIEEIAARLQTGEQVDLDEYIREHPEHAQRLGCLLPTIEMLVNVAESSARDGSADLPHTRSDRDAPGTLGDYRIHREIGRGGMGVVYEAEQISLGRRVALKVLPFAAVLDSKQLTRFKNEARAAGQLHHHNIVPVHSVGCERGVHYYAMQYIEGQTLADLICDLRELEGHDDGCSQDGEVSLSLAHSLAAGKFALEHATSSISDAAAADEEAASFAAVQETVREPQAAISTARSDRSPAYFRSIARLGIEVARALDHAHQHGIIHRDIKPSNIILDTEGKSWITDFGLARVEASATLTISGDLLGTLRYMSPEQALAKRVVLDHRTDIYSLGVTLYELLALRPVFSGRDRQELMRQIAFDEPQPLRRLNRAIPREIETIVHKAAAKDPAGRYGTSQDLADDLQRFLDDEPIRARRPSLVERSAKWSRRHQTVVWAAAVALITCALGAIGLGWSRYQKGISAKGDVENHLAAARALLQSGDYATAKQEAIEAEARLNASNISAESLASDVAAVANEITAKTDAQQQFSQFQAFRQAVHADMYGGTAEPIGRARNNCQAALALYDTSDDGDWDEAQSFQNLEPAQRLAVKEGAAELLFVSALLDVTQEREAADEAAAHRKAIETLERIETIHRRIPAVDLWIADSYRALGDAESAQKAEGRAESLEPRSALDYFVLGEFQYRRNHEGDRETALASYASALQEQPDHFLSLLAYGLTLWELERRDMAEAILTGAIAVNSRTAVAYIRRGQIRCEQKKRDLATDDFRQAVTLDPDDYEAYWALAAFLGEEGKQTEAQKMCRKAVERAPPDVIQLLVWYGVCCARLADHPQAVTYFTRALNAFGAETTSFDVPYRGAILFQRNVPAGYRYYHHGRKVEVYCVRARSYHELGRYRDAIDDLTESLRLDETDIVHLSRRGDNYWMLGEIDKSIADYSTAIRLKPEHAWVYEHRGRSYAHQGKFDQAIEDYTQAIQLNPSGPHLYACRGNVYRKQGRFDLAMADFDKALELSPTLHSALFYRAFTHLALDDPDAALTDLRKLKAGAGDGPTEPDQISDMAWLLATCPDPRLRDPDQAVRWAESAAKRAPEVGSVLKTLGVARYRNGDWQGAIEALQKATDRGGSLQPTPLFFLAMAHSQLNEKEEATRCYGQAMTSIETSQTDDQELKRFQAEAAALLNAGNRPREDVDPRH